MKHEQWLSMSNQQRIATKAVHARAMAGILRTLSDSFPVRIDTYFQTERGSIGLPDHALSESKTAVDSAMLLLKEHGLVTFKKNEPDLGLFNDVVFTPSGYAFASQLGSPKFKQRLLDVHAQTDDLFAVEAYREFMFFWAEELGVYRR